MASPPRVFLSFVGEYLSIPLRGSQHIAPINYRSLCLRGVEVDFVGGAVSDDDAVVHGHEGDEKQPDDDVAAAVYEYILQ